MPILKPYLTGRGDSTMRESQGVASLALGYVLHWAFSPSLLNPKLELIIAGAYKVGRKSHNR